ncbi:MAG TPA: DUF6599 family protein [Candidatus Sulfotelmatobacter sp.]|nr:DUF6599 family protein [Candidatus Sulfotelmatobacter sp.]
MSFSRSAGVLFSLACLLGMAVAADKPAAQKPARSPEPAPAILPPQFGGWQMQGSAQTSTDPTVADPANAEVLKEYGFSDAALATYTRDDGRTLKIRAARFADASGAFGAYTFYLQPQMMAENTKEDKIGDQAAALGQRVLFYRGHVLVDAQFSRESAMSGAQLRELAGELPRPIGSLANLPTFIEFMPHQGYITNTQKYVMGPAALTALAAPVSADLVDFNTSSEVSLGRYNTPSGEATLMLISYPTPQLAALHLQRIDAARKMAQPQDGVSSIENAGSFFDKRTGPIVVIASGGVSDSDAKSLLGMVNYEASVTWNQPTDNPQVRDLYMLILNIVVLCGILAGLAIVAGVAFGGIRILMKRWYPDKVFDRPEQMEFISLRLTETIVAETIVQGPPETGTDGSRQVPQNPA